MLKFTETSPESSVEGTAGSAANEMQQHNVPIGNKAGNAAEPKDSPSALTTLNDETVDSAADMEIDAKDAQIVDAALELRSNESTEFAVAEASVLGALNTQPMDIEQTEQSNASTEFLAPEDGPVAQQSTSRSLSEE